MRHQNSLYAKDITKWRKWLAKNHDKVDSVWLVIYKKGSGVPSVYYPEAVIVFRMDR